MATKSKNIKYSYGLKTLAFMLAAALVFAGAWLCGGLVNILNDLGWDNTMVREDPVFTDTALFQNQVNAASGYVFTACVQNDWTRDALPNYPTLAEAQDAEDFLRKAAALAEQRDIRRRQADLEDTLRLAAGDTPLEDFLESFNGQTQEEQERASSAARSELADSVAEEQNLAEEVAALAARVENLGHTEKPADLAQQKALLQESMNRTARLWARATLARAVLLQAKRNFEKERQPQVIRLASTLFESITGGQWRGISTSLENRELRILSASGESVDPDILSRGAQEQAYLALRLAYIQNHAAQASPLPIIMDDVLVNFDPERAQRTARVFVDLCEGRHGPAHQLIYFTCHPHVADMLRETQAGSALFTVENGTISRCGTD